MNEIRREQALRLEARVQHRLSGRIHDLHAVVRDDGLILQGRAHTYYAKQTRPARRHGGKLSCYPANEIEVLSCKLVGTKPEVDVLHIFIQFTRETLTRSIAKCKFAFCN